MVLFPLFSFLVISSFLSFPSSFSSVPFLVCFTCFFWFPAFCLPFVQSLYESTSHMYSHSFTNTHWTSVSHQHHKEHPNTKDTLINNKSTENKCPLEHTHTRFLSLPCCVSVCLYPLLGVLQLFVTPPPLQHAYSRPPSPSLQQPWWAVLWLFSATAARSALWSAPTRNPVTQQPPYDRLTISTVCKVNSRHQSGKWRCNSI